MAGGATDGTSAISQAATVAGAAALGTAATVAAASDNVSTDSEAILTPELEATDPDAAEVSNPASVPSDDALADTPTLGPTKSPKMHSSPSFESSSFPDDFDGFPPLERLGVLDLLDSFALPQHLEKLQRGLSAQTGKVWRQREALKSKSQVARDRMVEEWRRRVPSAEEQLERYRKRMRKSVDNLGNRWNDTKVIGLREKISFICGVMNVFLSGYIIGGWPENFHLWYTAQLVYFMPIRFYTYRRTGYHYFLADLCYFTNFLLMLSIWAFPTSKRLFMAAYCLSFGNNAVAIVMWRNSLVFHSFDKVTSLFIHIMPCAALHCIVHLWDPVDQYRRFPAVWTIKNSPEGSPTAYGNLISMLVWSSLPYAVWQLSYYFFITVRRRDKIAAGRPTSFTWLRRSYSKTWIGKLVLSLPESLQEAAFMLIQYSYAVLTMLPCPIWFYSRWASAGFMMFVFGWSVYNGATYYIDVFGKRFQKELESVKREVARLQETESITSSSPLDTPRDCSTPATEQQKQLGDSANDKDGESGKREKEGAAKNGKKRSAESSAIDGGARDVVKERKNPTSDAKAKAVEE